MNIDESLLGFEEYLSLRLRALYQSAGFKRFQMGKFEAYDLYAQFRDFLGAENIISFTDTNGKLMALKPDVTLFYAANNKVAPGAVGRVYYNENVYRVSKASGSFKEIMQVGVECLGDTTPADVEACLVLAAQSLALISPAYMMAVTSLDIMQEALAGVNLTAAQEVQVKALIAERNLHGLRDFLAREGGEAAAANSTTASASTSASATATPTPAERLCALLAMPEDTSACIATLTRLGFATQTVAALKNAVDGLAGAGFASRVRIDFSLVNDTAYYNGLAFQGFVQGVPRAVLMGGQYDNLLQKLNRAQRAVGFAVYMDGMRSV